MAQYPGKFRTVDKARWVRNRMNAYGVQGKIVRRSRKTYTIVFSSRGRLFRTWAELFGEADRQAKKFVVQQRLENRCAPGEEW